MMPWWPLDPTVRELAEKMQPEEINWASVAPDTPVFDVHEISLLLDM